MRVNYFFKFAISSEW